jgi:hypothetical protein
VATPTMIFLVVTVEVLRRRFWASGGYRGAKRGSVTSAGRTTSWGSKNSSTNWAKLLGRSALGVWYLNRVHASEDSTDAVHGDVDVQSATRFDRDAAFAAFTAWTTRRGDGDLQEAWAALCPLLALKARQWSAHPRHEHDIDEIVAFMAEQLLDRLTRNRIPALPDARCLAAYVGAAARRWRADGLRELVVGRELPVGFEPVRSAFGHARLVENQIFVRELPLAAKRALLAGCRFDDQFKRAAAYVIHRFCRGQSVSRELVCRMSGQSRSRLVVDWSRFHLREYLRPFMDTIHSPPMHDES